MKLKARKEWLPVLLTFVVFVAGCTTDKESELSSGLPSSTGEYNDFDDAGNFIEENNNEMPSYIEEDQIITGNKAKLLIDGPVTYDAMFDAIKAATDHVNLETFILADDEIGMRLAELLAQRVKNGVTVNLLYDAIGSRGTDESYFTRLRDQGINLLAYDPLLETEPVDWHNRNHRKVLVVDGKIGFTGGLNFTDDYRFSSKANGNNKRFDDGWRDTHMELRGPAVAVMQKSFLQMWEDTAEGQLVSSANYFPAIEPAGNQNVVIVTARGDADYGSRIVEQHKLAINAARSRVWITQAYFAPTDDVIESLKNASERGVDVRLLLPGESDVELASLAANAHYQDLLSSGVRIYEFRGGMLHAKTALVDRNWSTVGSSNFDVLSMEFNNELNAIVLNTQFTEQLAETFMADLERAREVTLSTWDNRSLWTKLKHGVAKVVQGGT